MKKFRVGQKVRFTRAWLNKYGRTWGRGGVVVAIGDGYPFDVSVAHHTGSRDVMPVFAYEVAKASPGARWRF
ncbi:hypothetical protein [Rhizobium phage RHph_X2_26]|nr:hypothetical protein [Rhizobium phage RHph_X2_26]